MGNDIANSSPQILCFVLISRSLYQRFFTEDKDRLAVSLWRGIQIQGCTYIIRPENIGQSDWLDLLSDYVCEHPEIGTAEPYVFLVKRGPDGKRRYLVLGEKESKNRWEKIYRWRMQNNGNSTNLLSNYTTALKANASGG